MHELNTSIYNLARSIIGGNLKIMENIQGVEMSTAKTGGLLWHAHVSELSDNDKAAIMQSKELKEVLNGQCDVMWFYFRRGGEYDV